MTEFSVPLTVFLFGSVLLEPNGNGNNCRIGHHYIVRVYMYILPHLEQILQLLLLKHKVSLNYFQSSLFPLSLFSMEAFTHENIENVIF